GADPPRRRRAAQADLRLQRRGLEPLGAGPGEGADLHGQLLGRRLGLRGGVQVPEGEGRGRRSASLTDRARPELPDDAPRRPPVTAGASLFPARRLRRHRTSSRGPTPTTPKPPYVLRLARYVHTRPGASR